MNLKHSLLACVLAFVASIAFPSFSYASDLEASDSGTSRLELESTEVTNIEQDSQDNILAISAEYGTDDLANDNVDALADGVYAIESSLAEDMVVDVSAGSSQDGAPVQLWNVNLTPAQKWVLQNEVIDGAKTGYVTLVNEVSGKVLDVAGACLEPGTTVQQYSSNSTLAQKWIIVKSGDGYVLVSALSNDSTTLVLDARAGSSSAGTPLQTWVANGTPAQLWKFLSIKGVYEELDTRARANEDVISDGVYCIDSLAVPSNVVDVAGASSSDAANVQSYVSNLTGAQRWVVSHDEKGYVVFANEASGKVLDVSGAAITPGTNVWQYASNDTLAQKWIVEKLVDAYRISSALWKNVVLDLSGASSANGANIQIWIDNGTAAQRWLLLPADPIVLPCADLGLGTGWYDIASAADDRYVLDVAGASRENGANAQLYSKNDTLAQFFKFVFFETEEESGLGYYQIIGAVSDKALEMTGGNLVPGTNAQMWDSGNRLPSQLYALTQSASGTYSLINKASGLAVGLSSLVLSNGVNICGVPPGSSNVFEFVLTPRINLIAEGVYGISPSYSNRVLDISAGSYAEGANVQIYSVNSTPAQKFYVQCIGENTYAIQSLTSGLYLITTSDNNVVQGSLTDATYWIPEIANGYFLFRDVNNPSFVLDVAGAGDYDACNIGVFADNGTVAQRFKLLATPALSSGTYCIQSAISRDMVIDVGSGSKEDGANIQIYASNDSGAQKWFITANSDGSYSIVNAGSDKALDVQNAVAAAGTNVQQWSKNGTTAQRWLVQWVPELASFRIVSALDSSLVLSLEDAALANGTNIEIAENDTAAETQRWYFKPTTYQHYHIDVQAYGTRCTLRLYRIDQNGSTLILECDGYVGANGVGYAREGSETTPVGTFTLGEAYGVYGDPGTALPYTQLDDTMYWCGDSSSPLYNTFQTTRNGYVPTPNDEHLIEYRRAYKYLVDIGYNTSRTPYAGSAFFLHVTTYSPTAGCVAISEGDMVAVLQTITPGTTISIHA